MNVLMLNNKDDKHGWARSVCSNMFVIVSLRAAPTVSKVAVLPSPLSVEQVAVLDVSRLTSRMP